VKFDIEDVFVFCITPLFGGLSFESGCLFQKKKGFAFLLAC
jgi:hypothetical protein